jgi:hypothetical protein
MNNIITTRADDDNGNRGRPRSRVRTPHSPPRHVVFD